MCHRQPQWHRRQPAGLALFRHRFRVLLGRPPCLHNLRVRRRPVGGLLWLRHCRAQRRLVGLISSRPPPQRHLRGGGQTCKRKLRPRTRHLLLHPRNRSQWEKAEVKARNIRPIFRRYPRLQQQSPRCYRGNRRLRTTSTGRSSRS